MKALKYFLFIISISIAKQGTTQIIGAQIDYQCLGNSRYEVVLNLDYMATSYPINIPTIFCRTGNDTLSGDSLTLVSRTYADEATAANCGITDTIYLSTGIRRLLNYKYRCVFDLSNTTGCISIFYLRQLKTSQEATTYNNRSHFYQSTVVNRCLAPCDASPSVASTEEYLLPHNQDAAITFNAQNRNSTSDSLAYEFFQVRSNDSTGISYSANFSSTRWITFFGFPNQNLQWPAGLRLDPINGSILFRPTVLNQYASVVVKITCYRNIGGTMTPVSWKHVERLYRIIASPNNKIPTLLPPYSAQVCINQEVCFTISSDDQDANDTLKLSLFSSELPGIIVKDSSGNIKHPWKKVCWTPDSSFISNNPYIMTAKVQDNACILPGKGVRNYYIFVRPVPEFTYTIDIEDSCSRVNLKMTPLNSVAGFQLAWRLTDSASLSQYSYFNQNENPDIPPGKYYVDVIGASSTPCIVTKNDSFISTSSYPPVVNLSKQIFTGCEGEAIQIGIVKADSSYVYSWNDGLTDSARSEIMQPGNKAYELTIRNGTCTRRDSFFTFSSARPNLAKQYNWTGEDTLKVSILSPLSSADYIWYLDHSTKGRNEGPQIEFVLIDDSKDHFVKVEGINYRCTVSDTFTVPAKTPNPQTSLPDHSGRTINAFPNPFSYHLSIQAIQMERINIYSMSGALLYSKPCNGSDEEQLYLPELAAGMYILEVQSKGLSNRIKVNLVR